MSQVFTVAQLVLGLIFYTLLGMGLLAAVLGPRREHNNIYIVMRWVAWPFLALAGLLVPAVKAPWLARTLAVLAVLVAWFFLLNYTVRSFAYWGLQGYALLAYLLLVLLGIGTALTLPAQWLRAFARGVLALGLVEAVHLGLFHLFRAQGWLAAAGG